MLCELLECKLLFMKLTWIIVLPDSEYTVGDIIYPPQKWHTKNNSAVLKIYEVNKTDSTFAGTYQIIRSLDDFSEFPFHGQYNPKGITIGWVVTYWSTFEYRNNHTVVAWAGSLRPGESGWILSATRVSYDFSMPAVDDIFILDRYPSWSCVRCSYIAS